MRSRRWSIRSKVIALLLLPLLSLAALWAYAADLSLDNALTLAHENTIGNRLARPLGNVIIDLKTERRYSLEAIATAPAPGSPPDAGQDTARNGILTDLRTSRSTTDADLAAFRAQAGDGSVRSDENNDVRQGVDAAQRALATLDNLRRGVDTATLDGGRILSGYTAVDQSILQAFQAMTILPNQSAQDFGQDLYTLVAGSDLLSQEDALVSAAAATPAHRLAPASYSTFVQDVGTERYLTATALAALPAVQSAPLERLAAPDAPGGQVMAMEQQVIDAGPAAKALPFPVSRWRQAYDAEAATSQDQAMADIAVVFTRTGPPAHNALVELALAGVLGLIALIASIIMSVRIARSLVGDIGRLRESARNLTDDRLRDVVGRLRRGENVDIKGDMVRPVFVNREIAELGDAFFGLQSTAVDLAREDIRLHRGISDIFLNLARRSQGLVHRQLQLLDGMEHRAEDPTALEELFRLDQLATRMRRYAEGLIIVSGAASGRIWRQPVPAVDVVRGAIAETEDFARVVVPAAPPVGIAGRAVADIIHLLAELIENAQTFSPADSQVRVNVGTAAGGLVVEIDDRGLGLSPEELAAANARITSFLDISALDSTRLGLVTVGRLAQRHDINVTLLQSPYGGVTAVVLIPNALLEHSAAPGGTLPTAAPHPAALDARGPGAPRAIGSQDTGRHRAFPQRGPQGPATDGAGAGHPAAAGIPAHPDHLDHPAQPGHQGARAPELRPFARTVPSPASGSASAPSPSAHSATHRSAPAAAPGGGQSFPPYQLEGNDGHPAPEPETIDGLPRRVRQASLSPHLSDGQARSAQTPLDWGGGGAAATGPAEPQPWAEEPLPTRAAPDAAAGMPGPAAGPRGWERGPRTPVGTGLFAFTNRATGGRNTAATGPTRPGGAEPEPPAERPEHIRLMMSALQAGAARGRQLPQPDEILTTHATKDSER